MHWEAVGYAGVVPKSFALRMPESSLAVVQVDSGGVAALIGRDQVREPVAVQVGHGHAIHRKVAPVRSPRPEMAGAIPEQLGDFVSRHSSEAKAARSHSAGHQKSPSPARHRHSRPRARLRSRCFEWSLVPEVAEVAIAVAVEDVGQSVRFGHHRIVATIVVEVRDRYAQGKFG